MSAPRPRLVTAPARVVVFACALAAVLVPSPRAAAQEAPTAPAAAPGLAEAAALGVSDAEVSRVAAKLNCPICQGYTLAECPLPVCGQMREQIRGMLAEGRDEEAIVAYFVDYYGPEALNEPPREGFSLLAWALPIAALAVAVVGLLAWLSRRGPAVPASQAAAPAVDEATARRLEALADEQR